MSERNLLCETTEFLSMAGKSASDVSWVGSVDGKFAETWEDFAIHADTLYDPYAAMNEVAMDLTIVGVDWWLERAWRPDKRHGWVYKSKPLPDVFSSGCVNLFGKKRDAEDIGELWMEDINCDYNYSNAFSEEFAEEFGL